MEIRHFGKPFAFRDFCISLAGYSCLECHQPRHLRFGGGGQRAPPGTVGGVACCDVIVGEPGQPSLAISQFAIENGT